MEETIEADEDLKVDGEDASDMFDLFVNPSRNIGTRHLKLEVKYDLYIYIYIMGLI